MQGNPNQVFFENAQQAVLVTGTHVRFGASVYAIAGITAVIPQHHPANRFWAVVALVIGIAVILFGIASDTQPVIMLVGVMLVACGLGVMFSMKDRWVVFVDTASGRGYSFTTVDQSIAAQLSVAIRSAIDARG